MQEYRRFTRDLALTAMTSLLLWLSCTSGDGQLDASGGETSMRNQQFEGSVHALGTPFVGRTVTLAPRTVIMGDAEIRVDIDLPRGYKLAPGAPAQLKFHSSDSKAIRFDTRSMDSVTFPVVLKLKAISGRSDLTIKAVVYYCEQGSNTCRFDDVRINIPVEVAASGKNSFPVTIEIVTSGN